jgi:tripartite-type tricarboxylate transporter receptor subunit TctC
MPRFARFAFLLAAFLPTAVPAQSVEEFYRGRQITMLVASAVGGGYDTYARVFARHAGKHVPGHPTFVAKNLPAAAGVAAANALANTSERDGSVIAALTNTVAMEPLFGNAAARFDAVKLNWLGSIGKLQNVCATWHQSAAKTVQAAREREIIVAAAGATSNTAVVPRVLNALAATRFKVVAGYDPGSGLTLALERGEAEGICGLSWSTIKASRPHWITDRLLNVIVQMGFERLADLPDVPRALDIVADPENRKVLELILLRQEMGRPFAAPQDVPADRVDALRAAFAATMRDPDFRAEAERVQMEIDPLDARAIGELLASAYGAPKPVIARAGILVDPSARRAD